MLLLSLLVTVIKAKVSEHVNITALSKKIILPSKANVLEGRIKL